MAPRSVLLLLAAAAVAVATANIAEFDDFYRERAALAEEDALAAYHPNPDDVTDTLNAAVRRALSETSAFTNSTRRRLGKRRYRGACLATNPIDRCWRCRANWASDRKRLARCALGFGYRTTGGLKGKFYTVTDPSDRDVANPKYGTLRWGAIQTQPLWIIFARSMTIVLRKELLVNSHKTIDGRGANVRIANGGQITVQYVTNVIIHNLHIHDIRNASGGMIRDTPKHIGVRTMSDGDGVSIFGSSNVWVDHISAARCMDGLIDAVEGSTGVTVSNCHFAHHNEVMLLGGSDKQVKDKRMQVTVAFNHFGRGLMQRMPRCRFGYFHIVNNDYTYWLSYAIGGTQGPTIVSQGNRYTAAYKESPAKEVTSRIGTNPGVWKNWVWRSEGDYFRNGAFFVQSGGRYSRFGGPAFLKEQSGRQVAHLARFAGTLDCFKGRKC